MAVAAQQATRAHASWIPCHSLAMKNTQKTHKEYQILSYGFFFEVVL